MPRIGSELEARIYELRGQGKLYREIMAELGISRTPVRRLLSPEVYLRRREGAEPGRKLRRASQVHTTVNGVRRKYEVNGRRPKPSKCEKCGKERKKIGWHHWDDNHLEIGLWLCWPCHIFAERIDEELKGYLELKSWAKAIGKLTSGKR